MKTIGKSFNLLMVLPLVVFCLQGVALAQNVREVQFDEAMGVKLGFPVRVLPTGGAANNDAGQNTGSDLPALDSLNDGNIGLSSSVPLSSGSNTGGGGGGKGEIELISEPLGPPDSIGGGGGGDPEGEPLDPPDAIGGGTVLADAGLIE